MPTLPWSTTDLIQSGTSMWGISFFFHPLTPFYGSFTLVPARLSWFLLQQCKSLSPPASATKGGNRASTCRQVKGLEVLLCSLYS